MSTMPRGHRARAFFNKGTVMKFRNLALCMALVSAAACGDNPSSGPDAYVPPVVDAAMPDTPGMIDAPAQLPIDAPDAAPVATGRVRFVQAAASFDGQVVTANLDVYVVRGDGAAATSTLLFANTSPNAATNADIPVGSVRFAVRSAGRPADSAAIYTSEPVTIAENTPVTAFGAGVLGSATETSFRITSFVDSFPAPVSGKAHVRVVNASHAIAALGLDFGDDGVIEIPSIDRFTTSAEAGIELTAATDLNVAIKTANSTNSLTTLTIPAAALADGSRQYVVIAGVNTFRARDARGFQLLLVSATGTTSVLADPQLQLLNASVANASTTVAGFDAFIGSTKRFDNAAFPTAATATPLKSFRVKPTTTGVTLELYAHITGTTKPSTAPLATLSTGPLEAGGQYLMVLQGLASDNSLALRVYKDELQFPLDATGKVRAINALVGLPSIDVGWFDGSTPTWHDVAGFSNLAVGSASQPEAGMPVVTDAGVAVAFKPGVRPAGDTTTQVQFGTSVQTVMTAADRWYLVAMGAWVPATGQQAARVGLVKITGSTWTVSALPRQVSTLTASRSLGVRKAVVAALRAAR